jgi:hypothetical protein
MKVESINPPREFEVGLGKSVTMKDCAHIELVADEQITLFTESGAEYDVTRKDWGYYATPSLNARLSNFGLRGVLIKSKDSKFYIFLVESGKEESFYEYLNVEGHTILCWLDTTSALENLEKSLKLVDNG